MRLYFCHRILVKTNNMIHAEWFGRGTHNRATNFKLQKQCCCQTWWFLLLLYLCVLIIFICSDIPCAHMQHTTETHIHTSIQAKILAYYSKNLPVHVLVCGTKCLFGWRREDCYALLLVSILFDFLDFVPFSLHHNICLFSKTFLSISFRFVHSPFAPFIITIIEPNFKQQHPLTILYSFRFGLWQQKKIENIWKMR